jgi:hypothetical protein
MAFSCAIWPAGGDITSRSSPRRMSKISRASSHAGVAAPPAPRPRVAKRMPCDGTACAKSHPDRVFRKLRGGRQRLLHDSVPKRTIDLAGTSAEGFVDFAVKTALGNSGADGLPETREECPLRQEEPPVQGAHPAVSRLHRNAYSPRFGLSKYFCPVARFIYEAMISGESMSVIDISAV